jgi:hypothetical protein
MPSDQVQLCTQVLNRVMEGVRVSHQIGEVLEKRLLNAFQKHDIPVPTTNTLECVITFFGQEITLIQGSGTYHSSSRMPDAGGGPTTSR